MRCVLVGLGGIGSSLVDDLVRFLHYREDLCSSEVVLIDGDIYQPKNATRQRFTRLGNKALVTAERLADSEMHVTPVAEYLTPANMASHLHDGDVIFLGVDRHQVRREVSDFCEDLKNVLLISGGNELTDGNIQVYHRVDGEDRTLPLTNAFHPEIEEATDGNPGVEGCDLLAESQPQLLFMNRSIATTMLNAFLAFLDRRLDYDEVYDDILTNNRRQVVRRG